MRTRDMYVNCPMCDAELRVAFEPAHYSRYGPDNSDLIVEDITGCEHAEKFLNGTVGEPDYLWLTATRLLDKRIHRGAEEMDRDAWEDEQSARYERWADR